jgi:hypothetical protein
MQQFTDPTMPRYQLPFDRLPRGFVPWPACVLKALEDQEQKKGFRFAEDYRTDSLIRNSLRYFYEDLHVAYRPAAGGVEVLAVGWEEATRYLNDPSVKVVQA